MLHIANLVYHQSVEIEEFFYPAVHPNNLFYTGFKATQEIGELALAQEVKIEQLEKENATLKSELDAIKTALQNHGIDFTQHNDNSLEEDLPRLLQNKPNPFNATTLIPYFLPTNIYEAEIRIYDIDGKVVAQHPLSAIKGNGHIELSLMEKDYAKGTYSYSLIIDGKLMDTKKMLIQ